MLTSVNELRNFRIDVKDGHVGALDDLLFDDTTWMFRYIVADTGGWIAGRRVLISPAVVMMVDPVTRQLRVDLSRKQIEDSPGIEAHLPVSRQHEVAMAAYYGWPCYWNVDEISAEVFPGNVPVPPEASPPETSNDDIHLRSAKEIVGYHIHTLDGRVGHVADFLVDENWAIQQIVVDTRNWLPGKLVLIDPELVTGLDWAAKEISVDMSKQGIKDAPAYDQAEFTAEQRRERVVNS